MRPTLEAQAKAFIVFPVRCVRILSGSGEIIFFPHSIPDSGRRYPSGGNIGKAFFNLSFQLLFGKFAHIRNREGRQFQFKGNSALENNLPVKHIDCV